MDPQPGTQQRDEFPELEHPAPSLARGRSKTSNSSKLQIQEDSQQEIPPTAPTHQDSTQDTTTSTDSVSNIFGLLLFRFSQFIAEWPQGSQGCHVSTPRQVGRNLSA